MRRKKHYPREMKIDPKFHPYEEPDGFEIYRNGIFHFNITRMLEDIESGQLPFISERLEVEKWGRYHGGVINEEHMPNVKLGNPILLAEIAPGRYNIIDGHHRIEKAHREGVEFIDCYKVRGEQLPQYLISENSYKAYIEYWNSKLETYEYMLKPTEN